MRAHYRLLAWQKAMTLVETIYRLSADFPADERFGLTSQMRRAAVSVPSNIAEGAARFMTIALGSLSELDTQLRLSQRLGLCKSTDDVLEEIDQLISMVSALRNSLRRKAEG